MKVAEKEQSDQMQQLIKKEEQDSTLRMFTGEIYNSLTKADAEEMIQQLNIRSSE